MTCEWFLFCENEAVAEVQHPILMTVPICQRCWDRFPELKEA